MNRKKTAGTQSPSISGEKLFRFLAATGKPTSSSGVALGLLRIHVKQ
jgi:hypothetical protein